MLLEPEVRFVPDLSLDAMNARYTGARAEEILGASLGLFGDRLALVSSFGAEAAVLLHMLSRINPQIPVLLLETEMLFPETLDYQTDLSKHLGLRDVRRIHPDPDDLQRRDPYGALHLGNPDACCALRKVEPLQRALAGFDAQISGRKRFQSGARADMQVFEADGHGRVRVNPLADLQPADIAAYFDRHDLPRHPLVAQGFRSIGCMPCTSAVADGEAPRAGRWRGLDKEECGIHLDPDTPLKRRPA